MKKIFKILFYGIMLFLGACIMSWPDGKESFKRGLAEDQAAQSLKNNDISILYDGFEDTPSGIGTDLFVQKLPNSGPWLVTVSVMSQSSGTLPDFVYIRENNSTGPIKGSYTIAAYWNGEIGTGYAYGSVEAIINSDAFYIKMASSGGTLKRYLVRWRYLPQTETLSTRTSI